MIFLCMLAYHWYIYTDQNHRWMELQQLFVSVESLNSTLVSEWHVFHSRTVRKRLRQQAFPQTTLFWFSCHVLCPLYLRLKPNILKLLLEMAEFQITCEAPDWLRLAKLNCFLCNLIVEYLRHNKIVLNIHIYPYFCGGLNIYGCGCFV